MSDTPYKQLEERVDEFGRMITMKPRRIYIVIFYDPFISTPKYLKLNFISLKNCFFWQQRENVGQCKNVIFRLYRS